MDFLEWKSRVEQLLCQIEEMGALKRTIYEQEWFSELQLRLLASQEHKKQIQLAEYRDHPDLQPLTRHYYTLAPGEFNHEHIQSQLQTLRGEFLKQQKLVWESTFNLRVARMKSELASKIPLETVTSPGSSFQVRTYPINELMEERSRLISRKIELTAKIRHNIRKATLLTKLVGDFQGQLESAINESTTLARNNCWRPKYSGSPVPVNIKLQEFSIFTNF